MANKRNEKFVNFIRKGGFWIEFSQTMLFPYSKMIRMKIVPSDELVQFEIIFLSILIHFSCHSFGFHTSHLRITFIRYEDLN